MTPSEVASHLEQKARTWRTRADLLECRKATTNTIRRHNHIEALRLRAEADQYAQQARTLRTQHTINHNTRA